MSLVMFLSVMLVIQFSKIPLPSHSLPFSSEDTLSPRKLTAVTHVLHSLAVRKMTSQQCYFA